MKRILLIQLFVFCYLLSVAQPYYYLRKKNFDEVYSAETKTAVWLYYELNSKRLSGSVPVDRTPYRFKEDPDIPNSNFFKDYSKSGYDRGHMMSAANNLYDADGMKESFYYTNVTPQTPTLNRGLWKSLEEKGRRLARENKVTVFCGNYGVKEKIGVDGISVPEYCWKILIVSNTLKKIADTLAYIFPDDKYMFDNLDDYATQYKELQKKVGVTIDDMVALHNIKDQAGQIDYMISSLQNKLNTTKNKTLSKDDVVGKYKSRYKDIEEFKKLFQNSDMKLPSDLSIPDYISSTFDESQSKINTATTNYLSDLAANKSDFSYILKQFGSPMSIVNVFKNAGICPCCGLPLSFPICGCRLAVEL